MTTNQSHEPERMAGGVECKSDHLWNNCSDCGMGICSAHMVAWLNHIPHKANTPQTNDFATLWSTAPRSRTARIEREDAEWWFNQNQGDSALIEQAKAIARAVGQDLEEIHRLVSGRIEG